MVFQRVNMPEVWQCPQGGIDGGESPEEAAWREVREETGLDQHSLRLTGEYPDWLSYTYDDVDANFGYYGQTQRWFLFEFVGEESNIQIDKKEFQDWQWMHTDELIERTTPMKKRIYEKVCVWANSVE